MPDKKSEEVPWCSEGGCGDRGCLEGTTGRWSGCEYDDRPSEKPLCPKCEVPMVKVYDVLIVDGIEKYFPKWACSWCGLSALYLWKPKTEKVTWRRRER